MVNTPNKRLKLQSRDGSRLFYESVYAEDWKRPSEYGSKGNRFTKMWYRSFIEYILPVLSVVNTRILEVGSGYGYLAPLLRQQNAKYTGMDFALSALRQSRQTEGCHFVQADARALPFRAGSFDTVLCFETIEHLADSETLVEECFRVTKGGGHLVFSSPNYFSFFFPLKMLADAGIASVRRYMISQPIDRTTTSFQLRRLLKGRGEILSQRAVRLAPPLFERMDEKPLLYRINDFIFAIERRFGAIAPLNYLGLHTICVAKKAIT